MHAGADIVSGLLLVALATTLVAHKETKGIVSAVGTAGAQNITAAIGG
jgi:hypothetical protein